MPTTSGGPKIPAAVTVNREIMGVIYPEGMERRWGRVGGDGRRIGVRVRVVVVNMDYLIEATLFPSYGWILVARQSSERLVPVLAAARAWADGVAPHSLWMRVRRQGADVEQATILKPR